MHIFEYVERCRQNVPGCENAYLLFIAPYLGCMGGPCIDGEYTLTVHDCRAGKRFNDVIYVYGEPRALRYTCGQGECKGLHQGWGGDDHRWIELGRGHRTK